uniref:DDE Tnp4 domain-containing protein n=1 Tax=Steinernema glaseri TaxID=37863 RepID=A0A1I7YPD6_9BILA
MLVKPSHKTCCDESSSHYSVLIDAHALVANKISQSAILPLPICKKFLLSASGSSKVRSKPNAVTWTSKGRNLSSGQLASPLSRGYSWTGRHSPKRALPLPEVQSGDFLAPLASFLVPWPLRSPRRSTGPLCSFVFQDSPPEERVETARRREPRGAPECPQSRPASRRRDDHAVHEALLVHPGQRARPAAAFGNARTVYPIPPDETHRLAARKGTVIPNLIDLTILFTYPTLKVGLTDSN